MATINGVEVIGDKTAHDFDLLDKNDGINLANGVERNREATEDNHQDIVLHRTDTDVHVTPEWKNSLVSRETLGLYWTAAQTADIINEISIAGGAKLVKVDALPAVGLEQTIYLVPKADPQAGDVFDEYVWVDGKYEFIGTTKADISNVVKYTDYATSTRGGVFKFSQSHGITMSSDGFLMGSTRTAEQYASNSGNMLINKGTLENVFTYKGFAVNSDVVHLSGAETIRDPKSFVNSVFNTPSAVGTFGFYIKVPFSRGDTTIQSTNHATFRVQDTSGSIISEVCTENYVDGKVAQILSVRNTTDAGAQVISSISHLLDKSGAQDWFYSTQDGKTYLGTSAYRWADVNTKLINGETVVTPTYLETKAEEWEFTLSDGSTVTKKIVMA